MRELVELGRVPHRRLVAGIQERDRFAVDAALEQTGVAALQSRMVASLSDGELQRVMIARALAQEPRVMLLDEPTAHIDPPHQTELFMLLKRLVHDGTLDAVVVATHHIHLAGYFADRLCVVAHHTITEGTPARLIADGTVEAAFAPPVSHSPPTTRFDADRGWFVPRHQAR